MLNDRNNIISKYPCMNVICLEESAFFALIDKVVEYIKSKEAIGHNNWVNPKDAMKLLNIKSKTTLQQLRDNGCIRFSQPQKKIILYDTDSIYNYLEKNAKDTF